MSFWVKTWTSQCDGAFTVQYVLFLLFHTEPSNVKQFISPFDAVFILMIFLFNQKNKRWKSVGIRSFFDRIFRFAVFVLLFLKLQRCKNKSKIYGKTSVCVNFKWTVSGLNVFISFITSTNHNSENYFKMSFELAISQINVWETLKMNIICHYFTI